MYDHNLHTTLNILFAYKFHSENINLFDRVIHFMLWGFVHVIEKLLITMQLAWGDLLVNRDTWVQIPQPLPRVYIL